MSRRLPHFFPDESPPRIWWAWRRVGPPAGPFTHAELLAFFQRGNQ